jgi:hypothetical protein
VLVVGAGVGGGAAPYAGDVIPGSGVGSSGAGSPGSVAGGGVTVVGGIGSGFGGAPYGCAIVVSGGTCAVGPHPASAAAATVVRNVKSAARESRPGSVPFAGGSLGAGALQNGQRLSLTRT